MTREHLQCHHPISLATHHPIEHMLNVKLGDVRTIDLPAVASLASQVLKTSMPHAKLFTILTLKNKNCKTSQDKTKKTS